MKKNYWQTYKNFEDEMIELSKYILINDSQLKVYSNYISNLIIRIAIEIESIAKELYKLNGGQPEFNALGKEKYLYYDKDCINYLNTLYAICEKEIYINNIYFEISITALKPLKNSNIKGKNSSNWNIAYQALKHDFYNNIEQGNIENLLNILGALYILNIYAKEEQINNMKYEEFDARFESKIFSVKYTDISIPLSLNETEPLSQKQKCNLYNSICILKYTEENFKNIIKEVDNKNQEYLNSLKTDKFKKWLQEQPEFIKHNNINIEQEDLKELMLKYEIEFIKTSRKINFNYLLKNSNKEVILYKNQNLYGKKYNVSNDCNTP